MTLRHQRKEIAVSQDDTMLNLVRQYGNVTAIPESELVANGLMRIGTPERTSVRLVSESLLRHRIGTSLRLLRDYRGYLYARDYELLNRVADRKSDIPDRWLTKIEVRAKELKEAGLPPLHVPEHFGPSRGVKYVEMIRGPRGYGWKQLHGYAYTFPTIDFIVSYVVGQVGKKQANLAKLAAQAARTEGAIGFYPPATKEDFHVFLAGAFDEDGVMLPQVRAEVLYYVRHRWSFKNDESQQMTLDRIQACLDHLETQLGPLSKSVELEYQEWTGDLSVVNEPFWYIAFRPEDREPIVQAYFLAVTDKPTGKDRQVAQRMCDAFEHLAPERLRRYLEGEVIEYVLETGDFRGVPRELLHPEADDLRVYQAALAHARRTCQELALSLDSTLLKPVHLVAPALGLSRLLFRHQEFLDVLNEARLQVLAKMSDEAFRNRFVASNGRFEAKSFAQDGHKTADAASDLGQQVLQAICARATQLGVLKAR